MKKLKRLAALLLCMIMMVPSQGLTVLAETIEAVEGTGRISKTLPLEGIGGTEDETLRIEETLPLEGIRGAENKTLRIEDTLPLEIIKGAEDKTSRIKETLALKPLKKDTSDEWIIYWNPGGVLPEDLATASNAQAAASDTQTATASNAKKATASNAKKATASNAKKGNDDADGRTPSTPVKTLAKALERAEELIEEEGLLSTDITIYAMNPMEIADGQLYVLNGGNLSIKSWPGRSYDSDVIFYVNGGQLTMMNAWLASGNAERADDVAQLIYVRGGAFQMGQNVNLEGRLVLDYRSGTEETAWETATASDATAVKTTSDVKVGTDAVDSAIADTEGGGVSFDLNEYIVDSDESSMELLEDSLSASTWRNPIIELLDGFDGGAGEYLLELLEDGTAEEIELVKTLYSDDETKEEFLGFFTLAENTDDSWRLQVETQTAVQVRNTSLISTFGVIEVLTSKTLVASRAGGKTVYWNPGPAITVNGDTYPAGNDILYDGSRPTAPFKTWSAAVDEAKNGTIICMQTLNLGGANAADYLVQLGSGEFYLASPTAEIIPALSAWKENIQPVVIVPAGKTLMIENVYLEGVYIDAVETLTQTIYVQEGDLVIGENVSAEKGYIQMNAFADLASHPLQIASTDAPYDGTLTVYFGGINNNIAYRYVDVVVPAGDLAASIISDDDKIAVGLALMERVVLHKSNKSVANGGSSSIDWSLRPDTDEDGSVAKPQNLELYVVYYYDAIYIDGVNGSDSNYGASCDYPVKTWGRAKAIWDIEMQKSLEARAASLSGMTVGQIETKYPMPEVIYICNTVTVDSAGEPEWYLETCYDAARGGKVTTEVRSHIDHIAEGEGGTSRHDLPKTLIQVTGNGVLSIRDIFIRNMLDNTDSVTIKAEDGGFLTLKGETVLSGTRLASTNFTAKDLTLGNHVTVTGDTGVGSRFVMDTTWTGSIEKKEQGVVAIGGGTTVEMNNGYIQNNNSYRSDLYAAGLTTHKSGTGVVLSGGAVFTMNGGSITGNKAYQYGAGVYLVDEGTTFIMKRGVISANNMPAMYASATSTSNPLWTYGVGVYAGKNTIVQLGDGTNWDDALITNNSAFAVYGAGLYSNGVVKIDGATISENYAGGTAIVAGNYNNSNLGIGMHLDTNSTLTMNRGLIDGNHGIFTSYGNTFGAGIYFAANTTNSHTIMNSTISNNEPGYERYTDYDSENESRGGAIYLLGSTLTITDSTISGNRAVNGGGIYATGTSSAYVNLTLNKTTVEGNDGVPYRTAALYGRGGGIYFYGYGNLTLGDGTEIINNTAKMYAGGLYLQGSSSTAAHYYMMGSTPQAIKISGNEAGDTYGGGIYQSGGSLHAEHVLIKDNKASGQGGGFYVAGSSYGYLRNVEITENEASDGGGLALNHTGYYYMQDCVVTKNEATGTGGAFYLLNASARLYLTESAEGKFKLTNNHAAYGGGISIAYANVLSMNIAGPIQNRADQQGSNLYLSGYATNLDLLSGSFMQPIASEQITGVYNVYIDDTSTSTTYKYIDMNAVTVEKKTGADPDAVFLNSGSSYLNVLAAPPDDYIPASFPIDLNKDVFKSGSVVLKPAATGSRTYYEPNDTLTTTVLKTKTYSSSFINATTNLDYYTGGKLPRRTQLGGFADASNAARTNVIVVGQGVYLSGSGSDANGGTSPADAVQTFDKAKEILKKRIVDQKTADENLLDPEEREGFSPFIYICGQVNVNNNDFWELNYEDTLYTVTNQYYEEAETRNGDTVYDAQIRRFASFVKAPMIKVGTGSNVVEFTLGTLIIDGMADSVVLSDQSSSSPVIYGSANTQITLKGNSSIRNNYYSALEIYGRLTLDENAELYNNQTEFTVRLYASSKMSMLQEARIWSDNKTEKIASYTSHGISVEGANVDILMSGNSGIIQGQGSTLLNGYGIRNAGSSYTNTSIRMKEDAKIEFGNGVSGGIYCIGTNSLVEMSGNASITVLSGATMQYGVYISGSSLTMSEYANITYGGQRASTYNGIYLTGSTTTTPSVKMQDNAAITFTDTTAGTSTYYGIFVAGGNSPSVELQNKARISGRSDLKSNAYGICASASAITNLTIAMNMETTGDSDEAATISNQLYGIYVGAVTGASLSMGKKAEITNSTYGVNLSCSSSSTSNVDMLMKDNSTINNSTSGIYFNGINTVPINIQMYDNAAIEKNQFGMSEYLVNSSSNYSVSKLNIEMNGYSRISGNSQYGIQLANTSGGYLPDTHYQIITMNDNAVIGGSTRYDSTDGTSGNGYTGIYANGPIQLTMNGTSKIAGNGTAANSGTTTGGIYLARTASSYYKSGTAKVILNDTASVCDNRGGGIYSASTTNVLYPNECEIVLNGIQDGGGFSAPSVQGNTDALYVGTDTILRLIGEAQVKIGDSPYQSSSYVARAIDMYGYMELDGRSTIEGLIYLNDSTRPITMTHAVSNTSQQYDLHLVEGFAGQIVVQPDGVGITDLTGATSQLAYFNKASAGGMAATRPIVELSPNLVLLGENYVYLSGGGNDANNGNTPSTAVRTFKRAKELLKGGGYYTSGANIIICTSGNSGLGTVEVKEGDEDWSFDAGGYVTNSLSGQTWQPLVIRNEGYSGVLISLPSSTTAGLASNVTFKNIVIDGGSAEGIEVNAASGSQLLTVGYNRTAVLGEGAVFQNNKIQSASTPSTGATLGVYVYGGTLEIDGGTIQNMVWNTTVSSTSTIYVSSAISIYGYSAAYPSRVIFKSGRIANNEFNGPSVRTNPRIGTISLYGTNTGFVRSLEMSGGVIENNRIITATASTSYTPAYGGAIMNYNGSVTISGGIIRNNQSGYGSAIYHYSSDPALFKLVLSGGQITGNTTNQAGQESMGAYSPIHIANYGMELNGGGADIQDSIYLANTYGAIKVSGHIYQSGRLYRVYLNQGTGTTSYKKGSVVVEPDGDNVTSVATYLRYFQVRSNPYVLESGRTNNTAGNVAGVVESQCLILMKAVYLDSVNGKDTNTGLKPSQAVKSFTKAKSIGELTSHGTSQHYIIYICGKAINTSAETEWSLPNTAYMCRYTGFAVYESDGKATAETNLAYYGPLVEPASDLTFRDIVIYGRRSLDSISSNGDSIVMIPSGVSVTMDEGSVFTNNYNIGTYIAADGLADNLSAMGGAFQVAQGATLRIKGGTIQGNDATYGGAIYLHASKTDPLSFGRLYLTGTPSISGKVYLSGEGNTTAAYVSPDSSFKPVTALHLSVRNDYNGRPLIVYSDGSTPGEDERGYYTYDDAIQALYDIVNNGSDPNILELSLRRVLYLDGQNGSEDISHDGSTPEKAFKTLRQTFEAIGNNANTNGVLIYIVDTVEISDSSEEPSDIQLMNIKIHNSDGTSHYEGYYKDTSGIVNIRGQVYFKRYSQPSGYDAADPVYKGYSNNTLYDSLFHIGNGGLLTLSGIYVDGHSISSDSIDPTLVAPAVVAQSPLVTVEAGGTLKCYRAEGVSNGVPTATLFINNHNANYKNAPEYIVGQLNGSDIMEGSGAGIELLGDDTNGGTNGGTCILEYTEFANLTLGDNVISGGTDVYSNGFLHFSKYTLFSGTVFLEGFGTAENEVSKESSRYMTVDVYGTPVLNDFQILMRDPYNGRDVVHFQVGITATQTDAGLYRLEERVKDFFYLSGRSGYPHILELQVPVAVYIDGIDGVDDQQDRVAGSTPATPVKSLKRAYELLKTRGGNTIYVVGTIQVSSDVQMTGMSYAGNDGTVNLGSTTKVNIIRYIQPDFARSDPNEAITAGYNVDDFTGVLLNVKDGTTARLSSNLYFDGHSKPKTDIDLPDSAVVSREGKAKAPLINVERGGTLTLLSGVTLYDNNNVYDPAVDTDGQYGGAIYNSGTATVDDTLFENNKAARGSVAYQDGTFTIVSAPEKMDHHANTFYLSTVNTGSETNPVWGTDRVIQTAVAIPENQVFEVDMDHAVKGRNVVRFTNNSAYTPNADEEHVHFKLGSTVPESLFLVEAEVDPDVLQLQNWEILKVEVPTSIYLVMSRKGTNDASTKLQGIMADAPAGDLFSAPEYMIKNKGSYDAKVSICGFKNQTAEVGIDTTVYPLMNLTVTKDLALSQTELYLAVEGLDTLDADGSGFGMNETSLKPYEEAPATTAPAVLGTLTSGATGNFTFKGAVGSGFMEKYLDPGFPLEGAAGAEAQAHMNGTSSTGIINARAKYLLRYKVEIIPPRRESSAASGGTTP